MTDTLRCSGRSNGSAIEPRTSQEYVSESEGWLSNMVVLVKSRATRSPSKRIALLLSIYSDNYTVGDYFVHLVKQQLLVCAL